MDVLGCLMSVVGHAATQRVEYLPLNERISSIHLFRSSVRTLDIGGLSFLI